MESRNRCTSAFARIRTVLRVGNPLPFFYSFFPFFLLLLLKVALLIVLILVLYCDNAI